MENQLPISGSKIRIALIILFVLFILIGFLIVFFSDKQKSISENSAPVTESNNLESENTPSNSQPTFSPTVSAKITSPTPAGWQKISNSNFDIFYPQGFKTEEGGLAGGGTSTTIYNDSSKILIEVNQNPETNAAGIVAGFRGFGYEVSTVKLGEMNVTQVAGSRLNLISEKANIFDYNGKTYKIILTYYTPARDLTKEQEFDQIISTFQVK